MYGLSWGFDSYQYINIVIVIDNRMQYEKVKIKIHNQARNTISTSDR